MHYIIIDAAFADRSAFDLSVHFERTLGRRIPPADLAQWLECLALDGGVPAEGKSEVCAVLLHTHGKKRFDNFAPTDFALDVNGKAFRCDLGEVTMQCATSEGFASEGDFFCQTLLALAASKDVESLTLVPDTEAYGDAVRRAVGELQGNVLTSVLAFSPLSGLFCRQEQLGYSFLAALGIRSHELS